MKVLWFSHIVPYPPAGGASQRSFNLIRQASGRHTIRLVGFNSQALPKGLLEGYSKALSGYCERVDIWEMPIPWRRGLRWRVGLAVGPFSPTPYGCRCFWSKELVARLEGMVRENRDLILHFDSLDLALYSGVGADLPRVMNHHNCESALIQRRGRSARNPLKRAYLLNQAQKLARCERQVCPRFQINIVCSDIDAQALRAGGATIQTHLVENGVDTEFFRPVPGAEEASALIFTGLLNWEPNVNAIRYFVTEIWPLVRRGCPSARFYLAGRDPVPFVTGLPSQDRSIEVIPNPEDMRPWLARAAVYVCPLLEGGGTRIKILDALAMGKPVVSTSVGCEGLRVRQRENVLIGDSPQDFAGSVIEALNDPALRQTLGRAGRTLVERHYDWSRIGLQLEDAYQRALDRSACQAPAPASLSRSSE